MPLVAELDEALTRLAVKSDSKANCEVLLVDEGSLDDTGQLLDRACAIRPGWRVLHLLGNHGQAAALYLGMHARSAPRLILLDGDRQNDPAHIPRVVALLEGGRIWRSVCAPNDTIAWIEESLRASPTRYAAAFYKMECEMPDVV